MLGAAELGVLLGVSRQRVTQLTGKEWFPAPVTRLAMGAVWELVDIERMVSGEVGCRITRRWRRT